MALFLCCCLGPALSQESGKTPPKLWKYKLVESTTLFELHFCTFLLARCPRIASRSAQFWGDLQKFLTCPCILKIAPPFSLLARSLAVLLAFSLACSLACCFACFFACLLARLLFCLFFFCFALLGRLHFRKNAVLKRPMLHMALYPYYFGGNFVWALERGMCTVCWKLQSNCIKACVQFLGNYSQTV